MYLTSAIDDVLRHRITPVTTIIIVGGNKFFDALYYRSPLLDDRWDIKPSLGGTG